MNLLNAISSKRGKQFLSLFSVNMLGLPLGLLTSIVVTRYMGSQLYGDYKFINSVFNVAYIICNFGFFHAGNRALVLSDDREKSRQYYGAILLYTVLLSVIMCIGLLGYSWIDPNIDAKNLFVPFLCILPFGGVYLISHCYETLLQADNQIKLLSIVRLVPKIGYLAASAFACYCLMEVNLNRLLVVFYIYLITQLIVYAYVIYQLHPSLKNFKVRSKELFGYYRSYGFDVYVGSIFAVGFASLTDVLISYFSVDNTGVGFFSLAVTFATPLSMIPSTMATTHYKDFSTQKKISGKLIGLTVVLSLGAMVCLWLIVPPFIRLFYGEEFLPVIGLNYLVCFGIIVHGMADFFNRYLGANGKGKLLRNASFIVGFSTLGINLLLIPAFGVTGAAYTKILSGLVYLVVILICYHMVVKKNMKGTNNNQ